MEKERSAPRQTAKQPALIAVLSNGPTKMCPAHGDRERGTRVSLAVSNAEGVTSSGQQCNPEFATAMHRPKSRELSNSR
jgi:hypothetical protein